MRKLDGKSLLQRLFNSFAESAYALGRIRVVHQPMLHG